MKILVINAGSSSVKYQLYNADTEQVLVKGLAERIGIDGRHVQKLNGQTRKIDYPMPTHVEAFKCILDSLVDDGIVKSLNDISAVGHRIVHGGEKFTKSVMVTKKVRDEIENLTILAPLHQPAHVQGIDAITKLMPKVPQVVVFDTAFHATMPDYAYRYAIETSAYEKWGIRKYGAHGTSHRYVAGRLAELTGKKNGRFIICHIGNGASASAVKDGKCIDTSMGYTPLEGLMMGTRSGDIDPTVVQRVMKETGMSIDEAILWLNKKSGLLGVSGVSEDMRDLEDLENSKENTKEKQAATLARNMYAYRVRKYIGSYMAALGGVDAIAMTAGVGENDSGFRQKALSGLEELGIKLDEDRNGPKFERGKEVLISTDDSPVKVYVIPTNEELVIMRDTKALVTKTNKLNKK